MAAMLSYPVTPLLLHIVGKLTFETSIGKKERRQLDMSIHPAGQTPRPRRGVRVSFAADTIAVAVEMEAIAGITAPDGCHTGSPNRGAAGVELAG